MRIVQARLQRRVGTEPREAREGESNTPKTDAKQSDTIQERADKLNADMDDILDELDGILEENREALENFVQVSGE